VEANRAVVSSLGRNSTARLGINRLSASICRLIKPQSGVPGIRAVDIPPLPLARFESLIGPGRFGHLLEVAARARTELQDTTVWNVNSTSAGGGVAEMLQVIVGYTLDLGLDVRWSVISGDRPFFDATKRLHNQLHGFRGSGELTAADAEHYTELTRALGDEMATLIRPGDVVLLHDPQTAGMASSLADAGAHVVWRCHVGVNDTNEWTDAAWEFLAPHLERCQAFVFSRRAYAPYWLPEDAVMVIPPSIDPFSAKNEELSATDVEAILQDIGVVAGDGGSLGKSTMSRRATVLGAGQAIDPAAPLVVQVSRWDRLKDMPGVMAGFVGGVPASTHAHLALVGPATAAVSDDPEGAEVLAECAAAWEALAGADQRRVSLVSLPMDDLVENATMVNAIQRHATVIVQKSLAEGFGLTVAEAMWKARPVIASAVGGIVDQVAPGTGILLHDPSDLEAFGTALHELLVNPNELATLGAAARRRVVSDFVGDKHLAGYAELIGRLRLRSR